MAEDEDDDAPRDRDRLPRIPLDEIVKNRSNEGHRGRKDLDDRPGDRREDKKDRDR